MHVCFENVPLEYFFKVIWPNDNKMMNTKKNYLHCLRVLKYKNHLLVRGMWKALWNVPCGCRN